MDKTSIIVINITTDKTWISAIKVFINQIWISVVNFATEKTWISAIHVAINETWIYYELDLDLGCQRCQQKDLHFCYPRNVGDLTRGRPERSLFNSYYTKV